MPTEQNQPASPARRDFFKKACAVAVGSATVLVPVGAGLTVFFDPLGRKTKTREKIFITTLDSLPADGAPKKFSILSSRTDAWSRYPKAPIGAIYLRKTGEASAEALNVVCPHAGCFVDYKNASKSYFCPCHNSSFALDGKILDLKSPSPRALDTLEVEIRNGREVWVKFQNFVVGHAEKVPVA
jgi:menaquinol-cytochrome c reductase iron-sulfur subunit